MKYILITASVIVVLLILLITVFVSLSNRLNLLVVKVEEGRSGIDIALEKRYDLINEQVAVVKKYLQHEYETLVDVTKSRQGNSTVKETE